MHALALVFQSVTGYILFFLPRHAAYLVLHCSYPLPLNQEKPTPTHLSAEAPGATFHLFPLLGIHFACARTEPGATGSCYSRSLRETTNSIVTQSITRKMFPIGHPTFFFFFTSSHTFQRLSTQRLVNSVQLSPTVRSDGVLWIFSPP